MTDHTTTPDPSRSIRAWRVLKRLWQLIDDKNLGLISAGVAGLGALTTFSTLVAELVELNEMNPLWAWRYGIATFVAGVGAAWLGLTLA